MTYTEMVLDLEPLERDLDQLRSSLQELHDSHERLDRRVDELDHDQTDHAETIDNSLQTLRDDLTDHRQTLSESTATLKHLIGRVDWLEHHVRVTAGLYPVDLDYATAELRNLTRQLHAGTRARAALLSDSRRSHLEWVIRRYQQTHRAHLEYAHDAVQHSKTIADTAAGTAAHATAAAGFRAARQQAEALADQLNHDRHDYDDACAKLGRDSQRRVAAGPTILAGQRARAALHTRMRHRITAAVTRRDLLPAWFTAALGYGPPAENTPEWTKTAADLLSYRITHDINDHTAALGNPPPAEQPAQRHWYDQLTATLRGLRQWP